MPPAPRIMAVQGAALIVAAVVVTLGVLGFIPGITSHVELLTWAGQRSQTFLFGVFAVSALVNVVHLIVGLAGIAAARSYAGARAYLMGGGLIYVGLWLYGLLAGRATRMLPLNSADNWLHFGLGVALLLLAVTLAGQHDPTKRNPGMRARPATH